MTSEVPAWINILANFGFPILIPSYLLIRSENKIDNLEGTIKNLNFSTRSRLWRTPEVCISTPKVGISCQDDPILGFMAMLYSIRTAFSRQYERP